MARIHLRLIALGTGITGLCFALAVSATVTLAQPPARVAGAIGARSSAMRSAPRVLRRRAVTQGCTNVGSNSFLGADASNNRAGGNSSAVLGGGFNEACDTSAAIGGGSLNLVGNGSGDAAFSFVGGGYGNIVSGEYASIEAGYENTVSGNGSFIGAGDYAYSQSSDPSGEGSVVSGDDSFLGAGDNNTVAGSESFVGAGTDNNVASSASDSAVVSGYHNRVTAVDGFVGSGSGNAAGEYGFVGNGNGNNVSGYGTSVVGGGTQYGGSTVSGTDSLVGAGDENSISGMDSFIGAGYKNSVSAASAVLGGGYANVIGSSATFSVVAGGNANAVTNEYGVVGGGYDNVASGADAMIAGGQRNEAQGELSFAAGYQAHALYTGSFVWSDYKSGSSALADTAADQFVVRASGGTYVYSSENDTTGVKLAAGSGTWSSLSDRNAKTGIVPLDDASILAKVASLPVSVWEYKTERGVRHMGPMAQDFYAAFRVGEDDRHITSIDEDGVALAAIKALHGENGRLQLENDRVVARLAALEAKNVELEQRLEAIAPKR